MALITYKDKVPLVENPDIADENKVTAQDMNEIKKVVNENQSLTYDSLPVGSVIDYDGDTVPTGYEEIKDTQILWTNPNPTTAISSSTNITLLNDDYDVLEIFYRLTTSKKIIMSAKILKGWDSRLIAIRQEGTGLYRELIYNSDTSYTLNIGSAESGQCIPLYIVGYKTGLFSEVV